MATETLHLDTETYNERPIDVGTYAYAETAEVMLIQTAVDDGPVSVWDYNDGLPPPLIVEYVLDTGAQVVAHNAMFDRTVLRLGNLKMDIPADRWRCTMVQALSHALPGSLEQLGAVLGIGHDLQKMAEGKALIQKFCKPNPSNYKIRRYTRDTHPEDWARFDAYGRQDVVAMRAIHKLLPTWNWGPEDVRDWLLDQTINDRGFAVDLALAQAGAGADETAKQRLAETFHRETGGLKPTQREQVRQYLNQRYDLDLGGTAKHYLLPLTQDQTADPTLRTLCEAVLSANRTSGSKYAKLVVATSSDGRFRGGLQFAGAARTRRWAGRTFQPQNLPSRGLPKPERIELYQEALKAGIAAELFAGEDITLYSAAALRGVVMAPPGKKLVVSDLSNIEGRILAYLAGEAWKLDAFRAYDRGEGPDLYNITAVGIVGGDPYNVPKPIRNAFGKVPDLALGYEGGVGALQKFAKDYGIRMAEQWETIQQSADPALVDQARRNWDLFGYDKGVEYDEWTASEVVKLMWRERHPATRALWYACKDAAINAIRDPFTEYPAGPHLVFQRVIHPSGDWLRVLLPSGRYLTYYRPELAADGSITYWGESQDKSGGKRAWSKQYWYGGKGVENACQALAGDVLKAALPGLEAIGLPLVLTVHDEVVCEADPWRHVDEASRVLATPPTWAPDLPLAAAGFEALAYRKD